MDLALELSLIHISLEIARNMQMNIKTERKEDDLWGTIEMSFNNMWFLDCPLEGMALYKGGIAMYTWPSKIRSGMKR